MNEFQQKIDEHNKEKARKAEVTAETDRIIKAIEESTQKIVNALKGK